MMISLFPAVSLFRYCCCCCCCTTQELFIPVVFKTHCLPQGRLVNLAEEPGYKFQLSCEREIKGRGSGGGDLGGGHEREYGHHSELLFLKSSSVPSLAFGPHFKQIFFFWSFTLQFLIESISSSNNKV